MGDFQLVYLYKMVILTAMMNPHPLGPLGCKLEASILGAVAGAQFVRTVAPAYGIPVASRAIFLGPGWGWGLWRNMKKAMVGGLST